MRMVLVIAVGVVIFLVGCQRRLIYFPPAYVPADLSLLPRDGVQLTFATSSGRQTAFYVPAGAIADVSYIVRAVTAAEAGHAAAAADGTGAASNAASPPRRLWVCFHGNGATALDWLETTQGVRAPGVGFLLVDYPGYGLSQGRPTRSSIVEATEGAYAALAAHYGVTTADLDRDVGALGFSLGSAAALEFASRHPVQRVVLLAPFTSLVEMARRTVGWPLCELLLDRFDNRARLAELAARPVPPRVTIFHGTVDDVIPFAMGQELSRAHPEMIEFHAVPGSDHNSLPMHVERPLQILLEQPPEPAP